MTSQNTTDENGFEAMLGDFKKYMTEKRENSTDRAIDEGSREIVSLEDRFRNYFLQIQNQLNHISGMQGRLLRELNTGMRMMSIFQAKAEIDHGNAMQSFPQDDPPSPIHAEARLELLREAILNMFPPDNPPAGFGISLASFGQENVLPASEKRTVACPKLLEICKAKCCRYDVFLTKEEVLSGKYDWDITTPYMLRRKDGYCCYLDINGFGCTLEGELKPLVCRNYDCENDNRMKAFFAQQRESAPCTSEA